MRRSGLCSVFMVLVGVGSFCGCEGTPSGPPPEKRFTVSGTVNLDGKALADGKINFVDAKGGGDGGDVKNGSYSAKVTAGSKKVQCTASEATSKPVEGKQGVMEVVSLIPPKYNSKTELKEEISADKSGLNFDLKTK